MKVIMLIVYLQIAIYQSVYVARTMKRLSKLQTPDFIKYYGYPCEVHEVVTEDGYILNMHHIPHGKNGTNDKIQPVVFLQHGIFSYSGDWFISGPGKALGFVLADAGYDVWVGNARGNKYSRNHQEFDPDFDADFWDFSWHEIGIYDLPAMIDYILDYTQQERLSYIGHSQGTTCYYVLLSEKPEYNKKITAQYSLAPVAYMSHMYGPGLKFLSYIEKLLEFSANLLNIYELKHDSFIFRAFFHRFCSINVIKELCIREIFSITGYNTRQFNDSLLPIIAANFPAGASIKQLQHYAQEIKSGKFQQFDYGLLRNQIAYSDFFPPKYNLSNVQAPIYLIYSLNDYLSNPKDVKRLFWELPRGNKHVWRVADDNWNHIDHMWGIEAKEYVYDKIIASLDSFNSAPRKNATTA